jgi:ribosomal-protein-serine acetyltransferase
MFKFQIDSGLDLRILELRHAPDVFMLVDRDRKYLSEWLPWVNNTHQVEDTEKFIQAELNRFARNNGFSSGIFYKGMLVGGLGVHNIDWNQRKTSLGYWLAEPYQGHGIMTKACTKVVDFLFNHLGLNTVEIRACNENYKSRAIPERLGFQIAGTVRLAEMINNTFFDHVVYGMPAEEWNRKTQAGEADKN